MRNIEERGVYEVVKREVMEQTLGATMLSVKWVLTNEGTPKAPLPKARLVAREFVSNALDRDALFSGTPGLAIARSLISGSYVQVTKGETKDYVTRRDGGLLVRGLRTAAVHGVTAGGCEVIKPEFGCEADQVSTRDAGRPAAWARHVGKTLRGLGYAETKGAPGVYYHKEKDVEITLHVDDFLVVGEDEHLHELKTALEKVYKLKGKVLGLDEDDNKEGVFLGRRFHWCDWGIEMEGNSKHIQELLKTTGMESCKSVNTPLRAEDYKDDDSKKTDFQRRELTVAEAKLCRRGTALCIHLARSWRHQCCNMSIGDKNGYTN